MPTTAEHIESLLEEQDLKVFKRSDEEDCWMIPFESSHVQIRLKEDGEYVWFRGSLLADLEELPAKERLRALQHFMELNDQIKVGRFCGFPKIAFEIGLPIEDGELTSNQFQRCLGVTAETTARERYVPRTAGGLESFLLKGPSRFSSSGTPPECN